MKVETYEPSLTHPGAYQRAVAALAYTTPEPEENSGEPPEEGTPSHDPADAYYDSERREFLMKTRRGVWISLAENSYKRHLRGAGFSCKPIEGAPLSDADSHILEIQNTRDIHYSGKLCGKSEGFHIEGRTRFVVTESCHPPEPAKGLWPMLSALFEGLLTDPLHGMTQRDVFHGWMQMAQRALRTGHIQPGQALAVAGPAGCGKSLLQSIITMCLGGRVAKPYRFMTGGTDFNGDLFEAEHLVLDDEFMSRKTRDRLQLGAALKNFCVAARTQSCHRKNRQAVTLPAWWRISITLNDDPDAMVVLPPLDDHVADKLILLRAASFIFPMPMDSAIAQEHFMKVCRAELPAYLHWLLHEFEIPSGLVEPRRYGVVSWHHPDLAAALNELSPEAELLSLADEVLWRNSEPEWKGTSRVLECLLQDDHHTEIKARQLLQGHNACGKYLGKLASKPEARVREARTATSREFIITAPV